MAESNSSIPMFSSSRAIESLEDDFIQATIKVLKSGSFIHGPEHNNLEVDLCNYLGVKNSILCGNGTEALQLSLLGLDVKPGDYVITVANAGGYSSTAVLNIGAIPFYTDVDEFTLLVTLENIKKTVSSMPVLPKVIIVTDLFGNIPKEIFEIISWAHSKKIAVLQDCAQSLGASWGGKASGSISDINTTSFYPTKNLGALGDGGAIFTDNDEIASRIRKLRQYGWEKKYFVKYQRGMNSRFDELQAAYLQVKLPKLENWVTRRKEIIGHYVSSSKSNSFVSPNDSSSSAHLAVIRTSNRDKLRTFFSKGGVMTDIHYPYPDFLQPGFIPTSHQDYWKKQLPNTVKGCDSVVSIPVFPELLDQEIAQITSLLSSYFEAK